MSLKVPVLLSASDATLLTAPWRTPSGGNEEGLSSLLGASLFCCLGFSAIGTASVHLRYHPDRCIIYAYSPKCLEGKQTEAPFRDFAIPGLIGHNAGHGRTQSGPARVDFRNRAARGPGACLPGGG